MALHSGGTLAAAVSAAGGLGCFGGTHPWKGPDWIRAEIATVRATTDRPLMSHTGRLIDSRATLWPWPPRARSSDVRIRLASRR
ncbi:nitronate monooxygenase [Streptomyces sp900116325]|uniref:nitronate monooxygenase n=1 Tax=Streptomyces sp. 900116325 TaxID=3154295 RepID=UPI003321E7E8